MQIFFLNFSKLHLPVTDRKTHNTVSPFFFCFFFTVFHERKNFLLFFSIHWYDSCNSESVLCRTQSGSCCSHWSSGSEEVCMSAICCYFGHPLAPYNDTLIHIYWQVVQKKQKQEEQEKIVSGENQMVIKVHLKKYLNLLRLDRHQPILLKLITEISICILADN